MKAADLGCLRAPQVLLLGTADEHAAAYRRVSVQGPGTGPGIVSNAAVKFEPYSRIRDLP